MREEKREQRIRGDDGDDEVTSTNSSQKVSLQFVTVLFHLIYGTLHSDPVLKIFDKLERDFYSLLA